MKSHSWHSVPTLLVADSCRTDVVTIFGEANCLQGGLGQFHAKHLMLLAMARAPARQIRGINNMVTIHD